MYGKKSNSFLQKAIITVLEIALLYFAYWIAFTKGGTVIYSWFGINMSEGNAMRRILIFSFSIIVFLRLSFMMFFLLKRKIPMEEAVSVPFAFAVYYIGFAIFGYASEEAIGIFDYAGIGIYLLGSYLNTASELQRFIWKKDPKNKGKLYTINLFSYSMHINYFGDLLWVLGYAILTRNIYSFIIVVLLFLFFAFFNIPKLDKYLAEKYKNQFVEYQNKTKKFIPFIY